MPGRGETYIRNNEGSIKEMTTGNLIENCKERGNEISPPLQQTSPPAALLSQPPNGGRLAWTQCACTFCLWFAAWGLVNSFGKHSCERTGQICTHLTTIGVFQSYYSKTALSDSSASSISWIGSLQLCLFIGGTSVIGPIYVSKTDVQKNNTKYVVVSGV